MTLYRLTIFRLTLEYEKDDSKKIILAKTGRYYQEFIDCFKENIAIFGYLRHNNSAMFVHYMSPEVGS